METQGQHGNIKNSIKGAGNGVIDHVEIIKGGKGQNFLDLHLYQNPTKITIDKDSGKNKVTVEFNPDPVVPEPRPSTLVFHNVTHLRGSQKNDTIFFKNGAPLKATSMEEVAKNVVDYSSFGKRVKVNLNSNVTNQVNLDEDDPRSWVSMGTLRNIHDVIGGAKNGLFSLGGGQGNQLTGDNRDNYLEGSSKDDFLNGGWER